MLSVAIVTRVDKVASRERVYLIECAGERRRPEMAVPPVMMELTGKGALFIPAGRRAQIRPGEATDECEQEVPRPNSVCEML